MVVARSRRGLALVLVLAACGGGGGGGGGEVSVSVDRSSLEFVTVNESPSSDEVHFTLTGGSGTYYAVIALDRAGLFETAVLFTGTTTATAVFATMSPPLGTTTGTITCRLCRDAACTSVAWSRDLPYTVKAFEVGPASLAFTGSEGAAVAPQAVTITPADDGAALGVTASAAWVGVARDGPAAWRVTPSTLGILAGSHQGTVTVAAPYGGSRVVIPVSFSVAAGIAPTPDATHVLDLAGSTHGSLPVAFRGGIAPAWSATDDRAWLTLTQASGTGDGSVSYAIDPAQLAHLGNWSSEAATVQITSPGLTPVSVRLDVSKRLPDVYAVSPAAIRAGQAATVHVFGKGLSQLAGAGEVAVSGATGASTTVVSDTEALVSIPAVPAGRATLSVPNSFSIPTRSADVAVAAAAAWTAALAPSAGEKRCAAYDPLRDAVYAVEQHDEEVVRFRLVSGTWQVDSVPLTAVGDLGLSADRETLYVTTGDALYGQGSLRTFDPETFQLGPTTYPLPPGSSLLTGRSRTSGLQATNDARLWFNAGTWSSLTYFDEPGTTFATHPGVSELLFSAAAYASPDGSRVLVTQHADTAYAYTPADGSVTAPPIPPVFGAVVASRDGVVVMFDGRVYESTGWTMRGEAKVTGAGIMGTAAQLSPDGSKAYVLVQSTTLPSYPIVRFDVFDTASVVEGTTDLVKLGEIPVAHQAAYCAPGSWSTCSEFPQVLVGPLGDVLFVYGNQGLVVVPVPPELAGEP